MALTETIPLLGSVDDLSAPWFTEVLAAAGYADARVARFEVRPIGAGNVSDTVRVTLDFAHPTSAPASLICKFRCSDPQAHAHGIGSGSYAREVQSYRALAAADCACRTPRVFWVDGHAENINLVMEDLTMTTRAGDQVAGCSIADARSVVVELAKLHQAFFPMTREQAPDWGMTMAGTADYWASAIERGLPVVRAEVAARLNADEWAITQHAAAMARDWYALPMDRGTLTHGDPRVDNILFIDAADGPAAVLIDWQVTGWRNPMHDVAYFLSGSVSVEDRRSAERDLLGDYAAAFGDGYERDKIEADYRLHLPSGLMTTLAAYGVLPLTAEVDRLLLALLRRNVAAVADWRSLDAIKG